nr:MAG TPA: hypothetical protein [Siphoviridae sp. ctX8T1]DAO64582.1 MAG TPA: hypothetical protein [Caudoviricetes sp.]
MQNDSRKELPTMITDSSALKVAKAKFADLVQQED